jgi:glycosyltransferase involved in cell wall biosynthesis
MNIYLKRSFLRRFGLGPLIRWQLHNLRQWDQLSSSRVDYLLANSNFTAKRIWKYWRRRSAVLHPPVDVNRFEWNRPREDFYLSVCRLVPNKRVDLLVRAFNSLKLPLIVVGHGVEKEYLKELAGPTVQILGFQSKEKIESLMSRCRAFVYSGIEDFGIAPVEAMASGAPVIAFGKGGVLDTVKCFNFNSAKVATLRQ